MQICASSAVVMSVIREVFPKSIRLSVFLWGRWRSVNIGVIKTCGICLYNRTDSWRPVWTAVLTIYKENDRSPHDDHKKISLVSISFKLLADIIFRQSAVNREGYKLENRAGFLLGRGSIDQTLTVEQILKRRHNFPRPTISALFEIDIWNGQLCSSLALSLTVWCIREIHLIRCVQTSKRGFFFTANLKVSSPREVMIVKIAYSRFFFSTFSLKWPRI